MQYLVMTHGAEGWALCVPGVQEIDGMPVPVWCLDEEGRPYYCREADVETCIALAGEVDDVVSKSKHDSVCRRIAQLVDKYDALSQKYEVAVSKYEAAKRQNDPVTAKDETEVKF